MIFINEFARILFFNISFSIGDPEARKAKSQSVPVAALTHYREMGWEDNKAAWSLWVPLNTINFIFLPMHLRIPFMSMVSFVYCIILSKMHSESPTTEAVELFESLPDIMDEDLLANINNNFKSFADSQGRLDKAQFALLMGKFGVNNDQVVASLFRLMHPEEDNKVNVQSVSSMLFTLAGKGTPAEHIQAIFDAIDIEFDGKLHRHEVSQTMVSLLRMREALLVQRTEDDSQMILFAVPTKLQTSEDEITGKTRREKRLKLLKNRNHDLYEDAQSIEQVLQVEAEHLTTAIFREAYIGADNSPKGQESTAQIISQEEFNAWAQSKPTATSKEFFRLFSAFKGYHSSAPAVSPAPSVESKN